MLKKWNSKFESAEMKLSDLAPELVNAIASYLNKPALRSARFVSKAWSVVMSQHLFGEIILSNGQDDGRGLQRWTNILNNAVLRDLPKELFINAFPLGRWEDNYNKIFEAINLMDRLSQLRHVHLNFVTRFVDEPHEIMEVDETDFQERLLQCLSGALQRRQSYAGTFTAVKTFNVHNLYDKPMHELARSNGFRSMMQDIEHLDLEMTSSFDFEECYGWETDEEIRHGRLNTFLLFVANPLLTSFAHKLRVLILSIPSPWGAQSKYFSGRGVSFPSLEILHLHRYCIGHDDSMDWILAQRNLKSLILKDCQIVSLFETNISLNDEGAREIDWIRADRDYYGIEFDDHNIYYYHGTWGQFFNRVRSELPSLTYFDFGLPFAVLDPDILADGIDMWTWRYLAFSCDAGWVQVDSEGKFSRWRWEYMPHEFKKRHEVTDQADRAALDELRKAIAERS